MSEFKEIARNTESKQSEYKQNVKELEELRGLIDSTKDNLKKLTTRKKELENECIIFMKKSKIEKAVTRKFVMEKKMTKRAVATKAKDKTIHLVKFFNEVTWTDFMKLSSEQKAKHIEDYLKGKKKYEEKEVLTMKKK